MVYKLNISTGRTIRYFLRCAVIAIGIVVMVGISTACEAEGDIDSVNKPAVQLTESTPIKPPAQTSEKPSAQLEVQEEVKEEEGQLELLEYDWFIDEYDLKYITGKIVNGSKDTLTYVTISFSIYDAEEYKVGDASDIIQRLGPGEKWKFQAMVTADNGVTAKPVELSGFPE